MNNDKLECFIDINKIIRGDKTSIELGMTDWSGKVYNYDWVNDQEIIIKQISKYNVIYYFDHMERDYLSELNQKDYSILPKGRDLSNNFIDSEGNKISIDRLCLLFLDNMDSSKNHTSASHDAEVLRELYRCYRDEKKLWKEAIQNSLKFLPKITSTEFDSFENEEPNITIFGNYKSIVVLEFDIQKLISKVSGKQEKSFAKLNVKFKEEAKEWAAYNYEYEKDFDNVKKLEDIFDKLINSYIFTNTSIKKVKHVRMAFYNNSNKKLKQNFWFFTSPSIDENPASLKKFVSGNKGNYSEIKNLKKAITRINKILK